MTAALDIDFFYNWRRWYEPATGRYMQVDAMLLEPDFVCAAGARQTASARSVFSNWRRWCEPATGRYMQVEPLLQNADFAGQLAKHGYTGPSYGYALNNPALGRVLTPEDKNDLKLLLKALFQRDWTL